MSIEQRKITEEEILEVALEGLKGDRLIGTSEENKKKFDKFGRFLAGRINGIITDLVNSPTDHRHENKSLLDSITESRLIGADGKAKVKLLDIDSGETIHAYTNDEIVNSISLAGDKTSFGKPVDVASGGTGTNMNRVDISDHIIADGIKIVTRKGYYFPYLNAVHVSIVGKVTASAGSPVKAAHIDTYCPEIPVAFVLSAWDVAKVPRSCVLDTVGDIRLIASEDMNDVSVVISGFFISK